MRYCLQNFIFLKGICKKCSPKNLRLNCDMASILASILHITFIPTSCSSRGRAWCGRTREPVNHNKTSPLPLNTQFPSILKPKPFIIIKTFSVPVSLSCTPFCVFRWLANSNGRSSSESAREHSHIRLGVRQANGTSGRSDTLQS